jgi:hypothetical protein
MARADSAVVAGQDLGGGSVNHMGSPPTQELRRHNFLSTLALRSETGFLTCGNVPPGGVPHGSLSYFPAVVWYQPGVLDHARPVANHVRSPVSARFAAAPTADRPVVEVTSAVSPNSSSTAVIRCSVSASRTLACCPSSSGSCTCSSTPARSAIIPAGSGGGPAGSGHTTFLRPMLARRAAVAGTAMGITHL